MNIDKTQSGDFDICTASQNSTEIKSGLSKFEDIEYLMFHQLPVQCRVHEYGCKDRYYVSDAAGKVKVAVRFDVMDCFARYVIYFNEERPEATNFNDCAAWRIQHEVKKKLSQWIGQSERRKIKAAVEPNINRVLQYYEDGLPMAIISPDLLTPTDPEEVKKRRLQFRRELERNLRPVGFGYHQIRHNGVISYVIYGKPSKKNEQLLKIVATETGKKYGQKAVAFCDLNGQIYYIHTAKTEDGAHYCDTETPYVTWDKHNEIYYSDSEIALNAQNDIQDAIKDYYCVHADFADVEIILTGEPEVTNAFGPLDTFMSASTILRRRNACIMYCLECWDEESQTYHFDPRYNTFF